MARILIAEDQQDLRDMISFALRLEGHQVAVTMDGQEALDKAEEADPDLFILDIHMPIITGYEVCRQLKARPQFYATPIIMISAKGNDDEIQAGLDAGAQIYIRKPFAPQALMDHVNALLSPA
ncbi:MAG: response regulator [Chloroflexi bacterium]|nr:response regulator [Chloroflexota bacterium]